MKPEDLIEKIENYERNLTYYRTRLEKSVEFWKERKREYRNVGWKVMVDESQAKIDVYKKNLGQLEDLFPDLFKEETKGGK